MPALIREPTSTRERLLNAAAEVIDEGGYAAASVSAIAARAGLANGALYRHYPSKAELFAEVVRTVSQRLLGDIDRAAAAVEGTGARFDAAIETWATYALRNRRQTWALVYEPVDPLVDAERLAARRRYRDDMAMLLRQGIDAGELPPQDAELTAAALVGAIAEALIGPLSPVAPDDKRSEQVVAATVAICRRAAGLPPA